MERNFRADVDERARMHLEEQERRKLQKGVDAGDEQSIPAAITDTGCERELNEDRYAVLECAIGVAWIVCDGMGGTTGGELAAQLALDAVKRDLTKQSKLPPDVAIRNALLEANRVIVLRRQNPAFAAMGTTAVALLFSGAEVALANVGDSRAYLVRDGAIQQLTVDHTYVQQLVERGEIQPEEALAHPDAHILTRCLGAEPGLEVDIKRFWVWSNADEGVTDTMLLCSDGLYSLVSEMEIAHIVSTHTPQSACVKLVELAKARGGYDNITVSIIPLAGQLRAAPPPSAQAVRGDSVRKITGKTVERSRSKREIAKPPGLGRHIALALVVAGVAVGVTAVAFFARTIF